MRVKLGLIADLQGGPETDNTNWQLPLPPGGPFAPAEYRRFSTYITRHSEAIATFNSEGVDLVINAGDYLDENTEDIDKRTLLQAEVTRSQGLNADLLLSTGNHDQALFASEPVDFYTDIDVNHIIRDNIYTDTNGWKSFTYDVGGIRLVCVHAVTGTNEVGMISWFEARLNESTLPVVVISHIPIWEITQWSWTYANDYTDFQSKIDIAGNVQAVFSGHYHWDNGDVTINSVPYYSFFGSVLCPELSDNAYFIIEIIPEAVYTINGLKANIKITGFGNNGTSKTIDFTQYAIV